MAEGRQVGDGPGLCVPQARRECDPRNRYANSRATPVFRSRRSKTRRSAARQGDREARSPRARCRLRCGHPARGQLRAISPSPVALRRRLASQTGKDPSRGWHVAGQTLSVPEPPMAPRSSEHDRRARPRCSARSGPRSARRAVDSSFTRGRRGQLVQEARRTRRGPVSDLGPKRPERSRSEHCVEAVGEPERPAAACRTSAPPSVESRRSRSSGPAKGRGPQGPASKSKRSRRRRRSAQGMSRESCSRTFS